MDINKDKNYRKLEKMIKKAAKDFTHYIYADNEDTIGTMCNLQGYCEAYYDLGLITKEQFYKLDELIQNMNNVIRLVEDIIKNMEYVRILFKRDKDITPLNTFNSVIDKLNKLKYIY